MKFGFYIAILMMTLSTGRASAGDGERICVEYREKKWVDFFTIICANVDRQVEGKLMLTRITLDSEELRNNTPLEATKKTARVVCKLLAGSTGYDSFVVDKDSFGGVNLENGAYFSGLSRAEARRRGVDHNGDLHRESQAGFKYLICN